MKKDKTRAIKKVFVVDDHSIVCHGLKRLIEHEPDLEFSGDARKASDALARLEKERPDIIIVDISLEGISGLEFMKIVKKNYPDMAMLCVSMYDENIYAERALRAGGRGYIMKDEEPEKILFAIRKVLKGDYYLSDKTTQRVFSSFSGNFSKDSSSPTGGLSDRELEVFQFIGQGLKNSMIAKKMGLSTKTVESYCARIKDKLNLNNSNELVQYAISSNP